MRGIFVLLLSFFILVGCSSESPEEKQTNDETVENSNELQPEEENSQAEEVPLNFSGNIIHGGKYAIVEDTLYFSNPFDEERLYKVKMDGTEAEKLTDHSVTNIQIIGDWIFYIEKEGFDLEERYLSFRKMKIDGTENEIVIDGPVGNVQVYGDELIFLKDDTIHKMNVTDTEPTTLPYVALNYSFYNGEIVFYDMSAGYWLGNLQGDESVNLFASGYGDFIFDGEALYFTKVGSGETGLFRYDLEDGTEEQIITENVDYFNIDEESIYYSTAESEADRSIYKVDKNGENKEDLETVLQSIHLIDRYIIGEYARQGFGVIQLIDKETGEIQEISLNEMQS